MNFRHVYRRLKFSTRWSSEKVCLCAFLSTIALIFFGFKIPMQAPVTKYTENKHDPLKIITRGRDSDRQVYVDSGQRECPELRPPVIPLTDQQAFLKVTGEATYIYSAYYDERPSRPQIRILGISSSVWGRKYLCQIWLQSGTLLISHAEPKLHPEGHGRK